MKKIFLLLFTLITSYLSAQDVTGKWHGVLNIQGRQMHLDLNVTKSPDGYTSTMDSPDEGVKGIPVKTTTFENNNFTFSIPEIGLVYKGTLADNAIKGTFSQNGMSFPMDLSRNLAKAAIAVRPQEPVKPYPYHEEEVTFNNDKANITLTGTLTLPKKEGSYPAVILISGSGPQDRDSNIIDHKPFKLLADYLTRNGFAVLRYDDRGVGQSTGNFEDATIFDFATDAEAAFNYLKSRKDISKKKIGFIGHSEGGGIAPLVASKNADVSFIVMLAGLGIQGSEQMVLQNYMIGKAAGIPEEELTKLGAMNRRMYAAIINNNGSSAQQAVLDILNQDMGPEFASKGIPQDEINRTIQLQAQALTSPWFSTFLKYDPAPVLQTVKCPMLALNGDKDLQVAATANLDAIKRAAEKGGNNKVVTKVLPNLNHLFQETTTGKTEEYGTLEQTMSPLVLSEITKWLQKQVK